MHLSDMYTSDSDHETKLKLASFPSHQQKIIGIQHTKKIFLSAW